MPSATVLVRYWAAARAAAGVDTESVTLPEGQGEGQGEVLRVATVLVNGRAADRAWTLADGDVVEVLPPFAGG